MKTTRIVFTLAMLTVFVFFGCQESSELRTILPAELAGNEEVVEYFEALEGVVDEFEKLHKIASDYEKKEEDIDKFTLSDAKFLFKTFREVDFVSLINKAKQIEQSALYLKENLSDEEIETFIETHSDLIERLNELKSQYE